MIYIGLEGVQVPQLTASLPTPTPLSQTLDIFYRFLKLLQTLIQPNIFFLRLILHLLLSLDLRLAREILARIAHLDSLPFVAGFLGHLMQYNLRRVSGTRLEFWTRMRFASDLNQIKDDMANGAEPLVQGGAVGIWFIQAH
jgi:hypothetical protein